MRPSSLLGRALILGLVTACDQQGGGEPGGTPAPATGGGPGTPAVAPEGGTASGHAGTASGHAGTANGHAGTANGEAPAASFEPADHVSAERYTGLLVEIDHVRGKAPASGALDRAAARVEQLAQGGHLGIPDGIRIVVDQEIDPFGGDVVHTFRNLAEIEPGLRTLTPAANESSIHVLYVDGRYEGDDGDGLVLGFAAPGSWMVMFKDNIERACQDSPLLALPTLVGLADQVCTVAEASTFVHELGHLFGLVNNGIPMVEPHEDLDHPAHDIDRDCIMYWLVERSGAVDIIAERFQLGDREIATFDAACLADLRAAAR